eukprot:UN02968
MCYFLLHARGLLINGKVGCLIVFDFLELLLLLLLLLGVVFECDRFFADEDVLLTIIKSSLSSSSRSIIDVLMLFVGSSVSIAASKCSNWTRSLSLSLLFPIEDVLPLLFVLLSVALNGDFQSFVFNICFVNNLNFIFINIIIIIFLIIISF